MDIKERLALIEAQHKVNAYFPCSGTCFSCRIDLLEWVTKEKLRTEPITGCPKCHRSFV